MCRLILKPLIVRLGSGICLMILLSLPGSLKAQLVSTNVPSPASPDAYYLFYLHGGIVQAQGAEAVSPYYGKYEYRAILDSLALQGFHVISEVRPKASEERQYARKVMAQIDSLLEAGVPLEQITVMGASLGAYITMELALMARRPQMKYILLGLCSDYAVELYQRQATELEGRFLSIYEQSDAKGTCRAIFADAQMAAEFNEVALNMGIDHAFLYKPFPEWIAPSVQWIHEPGDR